MHALARARRDAESVALVTHGDTPEEVRRFVAAYGMDVVFASYTSRQGADELRAGPARPRRGVWWLAPVW